MTLPRVKKVCTQCKVAKPPTDFYSSNFTRSHYRDGLDHQCRQCRLRRYHRLKKDPVLYKRMRRINRQCHANPERKLKNKHLDWAAALHRLYGVSVDDYARMLICRDGGCWICGREDSTRRHPHLSVDHCHSTKRVRGLLCFKCNAGIGFIQDDCELLLRCQQYLCNPPGITRRFLRVTYFYLSKMAARQESLQRYDMNLEEFNYLDNQQRGLCACCGGPPCARGLMVDHDHRSFKVRGLLCSRCNSVIGMFDDRLDLLGNAVSYLREELGNGKRSFSAPLL